MRVMAAPSAPMPGTWPRGGGTASDGRLRLGFSASRPCFWLLFLRISLWRLILFASRRRFLGLRNGGRDFRRFRGAQPSGAFLCLGLPVGAAESFGGGEIPPAGFSGIPDGFEIARKLERDHGVAGFREKIRQLGRGVFSGACSADSRGDLLPVGHTVKAF